MKKRILSVILVLLMVFPLVFTSFADTNKQNETDLCDHDHATLNEACDDVHEAKELVPEESEPAELSEEDKEPVIAEPVEMPEEAEEPKDVEQTDEPEAIDEPEVVEPIDEPEEIDELEEDESDGTGSSGADIRSLINALEESVFSGRKGAPAAGDYEPQELTAKDFATLTDQVKEIVLASDDYAAGTLIQNGSTLFWEDVDGTPYGYVPSLREQLYNVEPVSEEEALADASESVSLRSGKPNSSTVSVFGPFYEIDQAFTDQYKQEGNRIANALWGASASIYPRGSAAIDQIAFALTNDAVVFIDSHGCTDNDADPANANTSYITLTTGFGLLGEDCWKDPWGEYYHCFQDVATGYWNVDGKVIANHMKKFQIDGWYTSDVFKPNNFVWVATCYGMATEGIFKPLLDRSVGVVYGYSREVSFDADYAWEKAFWNQMLDGKTVAQAAIEMKKVAVHDENNPPAYPIFVSSLYPSEGEDTYPGKDNVQINQTVKSTWKLIDKEPDLPTPTPEPPTPPEDAEYICSYYAERYYYGNEVEYSGCSEQNLHFLRFEWEVWPEEVSPGNYDWANLNYKAYAMYVSDYIWSKYHEYNGGYVHNDDIQEEHHYCCKVEAAINKEANGTIWASVPKDKAPKNSEDYGKTDRYEQYQNAQEWIFDHWDYYAGDSLSTTWAKVVYHNKWNIRDTSKKVDIRSKNLKKASSGSGYDYTARVYEHDTPDKQHRTFAFRKHEHTYCVFHLFVYDGVEFDWEHFDYHTGTGATATFKFHCIHGCPYVEGNTEKYCNITVDAFVSKDEPTSNEDYRYVTLTAKCDRYQSPDCWDHEEKSIGTARVHGPCKLDHYEWKEKTSGLGKIVYAEAVLKCTGEVNGHECGKEITIPALVEDSCGVTAHIFAASVDWRYVVYYNITNPFTDYKRYEHDWSFYWVWDDNQPKATLCGICLLAGCTASWERTVNASRLSGEKCHTYRATYTYAGKTYSDTKVYVFDDDHEWGAPTYKWAQEGNAWKCTATRVCLGDASHVETETVTATGKITTPATCTTKGKTTYTATFTNTAFATQTKTVQDVPALGHDWICGFEWSIKNGGNVSATAYFACMGSDCEEYREVEAEVTLESGYTYRATVTMDGKTYTETQTFEAKYFHNWVFAGFNWGIGRVEAIYYCQDEGCDEQGIETATRMHGSGEECHKYWGYISEEDSLDNIEHNGYDQGWTVVFDFDHEWDVEKNHIHWEWDYNNGNPTAKATFDCMGCEAQKEIDAESVVRVTGMVSNTYKATVTLDGETYTSTKTFIPTVPGRPWIRKDDGIISPPTPRFRDDDIIAPIKPINPINPVSPIFPN